MNIAVLFGGISTERNVSIASGKAICNALNSIGHNVIPIDPAFGEDKERIAEKLIAHNSNLNINTLIEPKELENFNPQTYLQCINSKLFDNIDCVFIALHGKYGEDGTIQTLLDLKGIKYTGSNAKSSAVAMDKAISKTIFTANGIITPHWEHIVPDDINDENFLMHLKNELGQKIVIKPADQGSTLGLTIVNDGYINSIQEAIIKASQYSNNIIAEKYIKGRELTVAIIDNDALPVIEISCEDGFYDYEHKYSKGKTNYICPADLSEDIAEFTKNAALAAYNSMGCKCLARVDFILNEEGIPYCLEVNTIPGFTASSLVPKAAEKIGINFPNLCEKIINIAIK